MNAAAAAALCAAAGMVLAGAVQQALTRRDRRRYPAPGLLVDVDGHRMHLQISGPTGPGPTVVLEAGMGSFSPNWHWVQQELAAGVRTVSYDRAGLGWSEPTSSPRDARTIAVELRAALRAAGLDPPFVLAGHSFGGLPVRAFAEEYRQDTASLVLVDASHPDQWMRWSTPHADRILAASQRILSVLAWVAVLRALNPSREVSAGLPPRQVGQLRAASALPRSAATEAAQTRDWPRSREQLQAARPLGRLPLAVLGVSEQPRGGELLTALQVELSHLTADANYHVVQGATHESLIARREHARVVARTIRAVVDAAAVGTAESA